MTARPERSTQWILEGLGYFESLLITLHLNLSMACYIYIYIHTYIYIYIHIYIYPADSWSKPASPSLGFPRSCLALSRFHEPSCKQGELVGSPDIGAWVTPKKHVCMYVYSDINLYMHIYRYIYIYMRVCKHISVSLSLRGNDALFVHVLTL